jgi:hypothetical protein
MASWRSSWCLSWLSLGCYSTLFIFIIIRAIDGTHHEFAVPVVLCYRQSFCCILGRFQLKVGCAINQSTDFWVGVELLEIAHCPLVVTDLCNLDTNHFAAQIPAVWTSHDELVHGLLDVPLELSPDTVRGHTIGDDDNVHRLL